jgi:hypothetical protein
MAKGVVQVSIPKGKKELTWYIGKAIVNGTSPANFSVPMRIDKDADFVAKRAWLVQYPLYAPTALPLELALPANVYGQMVDGGSKRSLSITPGLTNALFLDAKVQTALRASQGLDVPMLMRANTNLFIEVSNPAANPFQGDVLLVLEGYKVLPMTEESVPDSIQAYGLPFALNGNFTIQNPASAGGNIAGQVATISNNGEGRFLVKGLSMRVVNAIGVDVTDLVLPMTGVQISDSDSGETPWVRNGVEGTGIANVPALIALLSQTRLNFCIPRYISDIGSIKTQLVFPTSALVALNALGNWPFNFSISYTGVLLPK